MKSFQFLNQSQCEDFKINLCEWNRTKRGEGENSILRGEKTQKKNIWLEEIPLQWWEQGGTNTNAWKKIARRNRNLTLYTRRNGHKGYSILLIWNWEWLHIPSCPQTLTFSTQDNLVGGHFDEWKKTVNIFLRNFNYLHFVK